MIKNRMKISGTAIFCILLAVFFGCDSPVEPEDDNTYHAPSSIPSSNGYEVSPYVSQILGRNWSRVDPDGRAPDGSVADFTWSFKNNGTISVQHCCGLEVPNSFAYLFCGNMMVTYGKEMGSSNKIEAHTITMNDNGSFLRSDGITFTSKGGHDHHINTDSCSELPLSLSNDLLGTWQKGDGTTYTFNSDAGLLITSPEGDSGEYGYLVLKTIAESTVLTVGPLVEGTQAAIQKYSFNQRGDRLTLRRSTDGANTDLTL